MDITSHEYVVLPYYFTRGEYTPTYSMLFYRTKEDYLVHAIKVRTDVVVEKVWREAVQKVLPPELLETDGRTIFSYPVKNDGEVSDEVEGYLGIYDGKVIGIRYVDPRLLLPQADPNYSVNLQFDWLEQKEVKYTLIDYTPEEFFSLIRAGMKQYEEYWGRSGKIWEEDE